VIFSPASAGQYDPAETDHVHLADGVTDDRKGILSVLLSRLPDYDGRPERQAS
jgi:hypothetical protein